MARRVGEGLRALANNAERDAVRIPGRGTWHAQLPSQLGYRRVQGRCVNQFLETVCLLSLGT